MDGRQDLARCGGTRGVKVWNPNLINPSKRFARETFARNVGWGFTPPYHPKWWAECPPYIALQRHALIPTLSAMENLTAFLLAAFALTGSPGPNTLSAAAVGASFGRVRGLKYMAGLNLGVMLVALIVGSGVSGAILALTGVTPVITALAVLYFLYLAWKIATAPALGSLQTAGESAPRLMDGVAVTLANPKAYAAMAALFSGYVLISGNPLLDGLWKALLIFGVIIIVNFLWLLTGAELARHMRSPRAAKAVNLSFAALLLASVATLAF